MLYRDYIGIMFLHSLLTGELSEQMVSGIIARRFRGVRLEL